MDQFAKETLPVSLEEEMRRSYLDYAMSVIVGRALPDVRDGLKPVHRRVLYAMQEANIAANRPYVKCARVVGDVMGKFHPHGDTAIYDTLVRMAQDFSMRYPLIDGQGNFGSVDGDNPAAMRYTECRLERITSEMLADIDRETVDFVPNYDGKEQEPVVLPTRLPNLLINGSSGIAVGMATNIPPHNLGETVDACLALLANPEVPIEDLIRLMPAPDFPTAGLIYGTHGVYEGYRTGRGRIVMRARTHVEDLERGQRQAIIVDELPYQVNKRVLQEKIADDDRLPLSTLQVLDVRACPHHDSPAPGAIALVHAVRAVDESRSRKIRRRHQPDQVLDRDVRVRKQRKAGVDGLAQVMRRDVGGH